MRKYFPVSKVSTLLSRHWSKRRGQYMNWRYFFPLPFSNPRCPSGKSSVIGLTLKTSSFMEKADEVCMEGLRVKWNRQDINRTFFRETKWWLIFSAKPQTACWHPLVISHKWEKWLTWHSSWVIRSNLVSVCPYLVPFLPEAGLAKTSL